MVTLSINEIGRVAKFTIVGGLGYILNLGLLYTLTDIFGFYYLISAVVAFIVITLFQYLGNNYWSFSDRKSYNHPQSLSLFTLVAILYSLVYLGLLVLFTEIFGLYYLLSATLSIVLAFIPKYLICWKFIWRK